MPNLNAIKDFNDSILLNGLRDLGYSGPDYTWVKGNGIEQRLDRILFNNAWVDLFNSTTVKHGILKVSHHRSLLVNALSNPSFKKGSFKFQNMWVLHPTFLKLVENNWALPAGILV